MPPPTVSAVGLVFSGILVSLTAYSTPLAIRVKHFRILSCRPFTLPLSTFHQLCEPKPASAQEGRPSPSLLALPRRAGGIGRFRQAGSAPGPPFAPYVPHTTANLRYVHPTPRIIPTMRQGDTITSPVSLETHPPPSARFGRCSWLHFARSQAGHIHHALSALRSFVRPPPPTILAPDGT